jgi:glycine reductase complex component B subunit gamma
MNERRWRVVHYLNQFFGGIGGEDKAGLGPSIVQGPVGPGKAAQQVLGQRGEIVATVICGDNYFAEQIDRASAEVVELLRPFKPDALIAGPAFDAGRYGVACGSVCRKTQDLLGIPAITALAPENPGVEMYKRDVYIVRAGDSAVLMLKDMRRTLDLLVILLEKKEVGRPDEAGYYPRGILKNEDIDESAAARAVKMLLLKIQGRPFVSEVSVTSVGQPVRAAAIANMREATIALVTDGGLVPRGNPDGIEIRAASRFGRTPLGGLDALDPAGYEIVHAGYTHEYILKDPHRLVPLDVMRELEAEGVIRRVHPVLYTTNGVGSVLEKVKKMGKEIAEELIRSGVQGAVLTST